jgi:hypothetical protein
MAAESDNSLPLRHGCSCSSHLLQYYSKNSAFCAQSVLFICSLRESFCVVCCSTWIMCHSDRSVTHILPSPSLQIFNSPVPVCHARQAYGCNGGNIILLHSVWVHISVPRPTTLTAVLLGFTMSLQVVTLPQIRTLKLPSLLISLLFGAVQYQLLTNGLHISGTLLWREYSWLSEQISSIVFNAVFTKPDIGPYPEPDEPSSHPYHMPVTSFQLRFSLPSGLVLCRFPTTMSSN